jgi:hypothetical protein
MPRSPADIANGSKSVSFQVVWVSGWSRAILAERTSSSACAGPCPPAEARRAQVRMRPAWEAVRGSGIHTSRSRQNPCGMTPMTV